MPWKKKGSGKGRQDEDHIAAMRASFLNRTFVKDKKVVPDVSIVTLSPLDTGFPQWQKAGNGKARGWAEWLVPEGMAAGAPRILYFHGGGYEHLSPPQVRPTTAQLASKSKMPVLCIDYRKIPEHPHPAQLEDAIQALKWINSNGPHGRGQADALFCAGDSAGGGLVLGLALWLRDNPQAGLKIDGIVVVSPMTDLTCSGESYVSRRWTATGGDERDPLFRGADPAADSMPQIYRLMGAPREPGSFPLTLPYVSPLHGALHGLPPSLIVVGDAEVMLSDSVDFARKAEAAGSNVEVKVYPRMWHCFHRFSEGCGTGVPLQEAIDVLDQQAVFLKSLAAGNVELRPKDLDLQAVLERHLSKDLIKGWEAHLRTCIRKDRLPLRQAHKAANAASEHWHNAGNVSEASRQDYFAKIRLLHYHLERAGESDFDGLLQEALTCLQISDGKLPALPALQGEEAAALERIWKHRFGGVGKYKGLAHERDLRQATKLAELVRSSLQRLLAADPPSQEAARSAYVSAADALRAEIAVRGEVDFDGLMRQAVRVLETGVLCKPVSALPSQALQAKPAGGQDTAPVKPSRRWRPKTPQQSQMGGDQHPEKALGA
mmetsp:Transcript_102479/g.182051  ORF Transcript_102479/g.182051 Transcript_102479/m.182051 type:complete len:603 (+) Transcript_102479:136-1944(+)|eukprot:CAMPEP_0197630370 /NCGR_PEP_ID=MMETSP1338-20131121/7879_1 /TAXON_ID=43686 ORGANISM="Pelagodinium beii, Strain RCC1491" /NCGR_SAMPLE_ID=MMETSP1338 /ASSEMBLY_ACC=CAM_ASM_000754 /LENGTH=602 /DNA_ID=CAMNT_0043201579 /DNA_START=136 /DNA_END=1944 /DNA_ORIENTATION=-